MSIILDYENFCSNHSNEVWIHFHKHSKLLADFSLWQPKIYICIESDHYWDLVKKLIFEWGNEDIKWKFYLERNSFHKPGYGRPDKIIIYPKTNEQLKDLIVESRKLLKGRKVHNLSHVAKPSIYGLEKHSLDGIYLGSDPLFLDNCSWRYYRTYVNAWSMINKKSIPLNRMELLLKELNFATDHEGPLDLIPQNIDQKKVQALWRSIINE